MRNPRALFVFHEPISSVQLWTFALIWSALALYTIDSMLIYKKAATHSKAVSAPQPERRHQAR